MSWLNNVVGGISTPRIYKLTDNNLVTNGDIEDALSTEWQGAGYSRVLASDNSFVAPRGDYVLKVDDDDGSSWERAFQSVNYGSALGDKSFLLMLKGRADSSDHSVDIKFGSATTSGGSINNSSKLTVPLKTNYNRIIHMTKTFSSETDEFIRLELGGCIETAASTGVAFFDDIRVYEIESTYNFEQPHRWGQEWLEEVINDFNLIGGKNRKILNGWRYTLNMEYDYVSASDQEEVIAVTENGLNFVVPHIDNLFGSLMRWNGDFKNMYFFDRYLGHAVVIALKAVELENDKPRETGTDYTLA